MTDQPKPTTEEARAILGTLTSDEIATFDWLMKTIRARFGASDRFDSDDAMFTEMSDQLVSRVL